MKKIKPRKITAFAAALALAAQSGIAVISAEETESDSAVQTVSEESDTVTAEVPADSEEQSESDKKSEKRDPIIDCLLYNYYLADDNGDGILTDAELYKVKSVELNGKYFSEPVTSLGVLKKTQVSYLVLKNMKDFDLNLLKDLKQLKKLEFKGDVSVKNIEVLGELNLDSITVDTTNSDSEDCIKAKDIYPYIKCEDITVAKGEIKQLRTTPNLTGYGNDNNTYYKFSDWNSALLIEDEWAVSTSLDPKTSSLALQDRAYIFGMAEGESEYTLKDRKGNIAGKGKITVTAADEPNDPALVKAEAKPVKVLNVESYEYPDKAYILYDNGILYTFKNGTLEEFQKNIKDAAINDNKIYALSEDGVLYRSGHAINDKTEYTVKAACKSLDVIVCSDDCVRRVSDGKVETILENVKSLDEGFGSNHVITGIIQDKDDVTSIVYPDLDGKYVKYPLNEKFEPVKITFQQPTLDGGLYYVLTADNKLYEIQAYFPVKNIPGFDTLSETIPSASVRLYTENVKDLYSYYYLCENGNAFSFGGSEVDHDEEYIALNDMAENGNVKIKQSSIDDLRGNILGKVTNYVDSDDGYYSVRDTEGTERYDFVKNAKPLTHVKINYGIYKHGNNKCVLIQRDDNTLWKYIIETGELERIDEAVSGSEVLKETGSETPEQKAKDPEPEKTEPKEKPDEKKTEPEKNEPKEPSENENKDADPKGNDSVSKNENNALNGDISGDGMVDVTDLTMLSLGLLGDINFTDSHILAADFNHNGFIDLSDLATLRQFLSKKIDSLA